MTIQDTLDFIFEIEKIKTRHYLDTWCYDLGKHKLYSYVVPNDDVYTYVI